MAKYFFNDEWKDWIWSNVKKGVSKQRIYNDLVAQDYDVFTIISELRFIPDILRKQDAINCNHVVNNLKNSGAIELNAPIPFFILPEFISKTECQKIIEMQKERNTRSTTGDNNERKVNEKRISLSTFFELDETPAHSVIQSVKQKILSTTGITTQYSEKIQGQWYKENGFYNDHYDAYDDYNKFQNRSGNRTWTCIITLNDVEEGGETYFPKLNKSFPPQTGQALIWYNLNEYGLAHPLTLHTGKPVIKGEKFIITQWFRQESL
ncbi:MAG: 2OG-Fe(II) oxygenase [Rickettsiales bacterium]|jgi:prolyl 4-hydroxylase|nr:2OG-Fe(II) oxygenase [Rickettsiales bacterium]